MKRYGFLFLLLFLIIILAGCKGTRVIRSFTEPAYASNPTKKSDYIKIHLKDGGLYVLDDWVIGASSHRIIGYGEHYNYQRKLIGRVPRNPDLPYDQQMGFSIPESEITLIETNRIENNGSHLAALTIVGVPTALTSIYCLANPKACFGSCPTFYARKNNNWMLMAEGFSSSISPSYEEKDIDMLYGADEAKDSLWLKLTNEALETHVIRYVDLLAFTHTEGQEVFATTKGQFYRTSNILAPLSCRAEEGDCLDLVKEMDRQERFCPADDKNLARKEEITITFYNDDRSERGLLIGSKQTLLTTHLFYQVMAYTGHHYATMVSDLEKGNKEMNNRIEKLWDKLGGIEIFIQNEHKKWEKLDEINEMGPIASDVHLVKIPGRYRGKINVKLRLTKGLWRIDYLALAQLAGEETPLRIKPCMVLKDSLLDTVTLATLVERENPLVTMPGDLYELKYKIPSDCTYHFFLETKGYYLEWMRDSWLEEQDLKKAAIAFYFPGLFMRKAATGYKKVEPQMEKIFWESRYVKQ